MNPSRLDVLFEPVRIGPVTAPNRFYAVPHATGHGWSQPNGAIALRAMKAEGGWGTVAVQITEISPDTDMANHPMERIWDDSDIPRHAAQVEAIKRHGSLAAIELGHGGARARNITTGLPVIGPSALPVLRPEVPIQVKAMDKADIRKFREAHMAAVKRAALAGYDIIYVYASHDISILNHFLSASINRRNDEYGGSFDNRLRLLREVLQDTLETVGGSRAVAIRFSVAEPGRSRGLTHDGEGRDVVEALAELPDLWDVNISGWSSDSASARFSDEGFQLAYTDFVKPLTSKPVVGVGRFTSPEFMASLVRNGRLDLIGAARPSIADPFLPNKIRDGRIEELRECIGCNICVGMDSYGVPVRCTQNPTISEEWRSGWHPEAPAQSRGRKSHLVIGSGPAGLECATTLLRADQKVTVAESLNRAGGRASRESGLAGLATWARIRDHRTQQLLRSTDAELYLSSCMTAEDIVDFGADSVTIATGSVWRRDGVGSTNFDPINFGSKQVLTPDDIMDGSILADDQSRCIVYDDDHFYMASVVAEHLARSGSRVVLATPLPEIATWTGHTLEQAKIIERLSVLGVQLKPNLRIVDGPGFLCNLSGRKEALDAECVVFVGARRPVDGLHRQLLNKDGIGEIHIAGDCLAPGNIQAAVLSGHRTARSILGEFGKGSEFRREQMRCC